MLVIKDKVHFKETMKFAIRTGQAKSLKEKLRYLRDYSDKDVKCELYKDFAPYSFSFIISHKKDNDFVPWFHGGLIYHGNCDGFGSGKEPTLSVAISPTTGWSVHT